MQRFAETINRVNEWVGKAVSFLLVAMVATICYEVTARYFFNRPTIWSFDISTYLLGIYCLLGGGFALLRGGHVNVDILYGRFTFRKRAVLDCITSFFFFIFIAVLVWNGWKMSYHSFLQKETSGTILDWPLFPTMFMVPTGAFLLLLQGIVKFANDLLTAITGKRPEGVKAEGMFDRSKEQ
jgi:TRAP-type mannitol/chloroaromatic compound transport system permease small subunit